MFIYSAFDFVIEFPGRHYLRSKLGPKGTDRWKTKDVRLAISFKSIEDANLTAKKLGLELYKVRNRSIHLEE